MKKKLYTLICAGLIMVASAMSSYAAEIEGIDGINIEKADDCSAAYRCACCRQGVPAYASYCPNCGQRISM